MKKPLYFALAIFILLFAAYLSKIRFGVNTEYDENNPQKLSSQLKGGEKSKEFIEGELLNKKPLTLNEKHLITFNQ